MPDSNGNGSRKLPPAFEKYGKVLVVIIGSATAGGVLKNCVIDSAKAVGLQTQKMAVEFADKNSSDHTAIRGEVRAVDRRLSGRISDSEERLDGQLRTVQDTQLEMFKALAPKAARRFEKKSRGR